MKKFDATEVEEMEKDKVRGLLYYDYKGEIETMRQITDVYNKGSIESMTETEKEIHAANDELLQ